MAPRLHIKTLVCPYDFTPYSREGLEMAITVAQGLRCALHVLHVIALPPTLAMAQGEFVQGIIEEEARIVSRLSDELGPAMKAEVERIGGDVQDVTCIVKEGLHEDLAIREYAELVGADLIVMASHGRRGLARFFLGSTAERVLRTSPCPVLIVRPKELTVRDRLTDPE